MDNDRRQIELLHCLLFSLPGTPVLYYGDEIGMGDNIYLGDRNGVRTPMQWTGDRNSGFSPGRSVALYQPVILDPISHYQASTWKRVCSNESFLMWLRRLFRSQKIPGVWPGNPELVPCENHRVRLPSRIRKATVLVVNNLSAFAQSAELDLRPFVGSVPVELSRQPRIPENCGTAPTS